MSVKMKVPGLIVGEVIEVVVSPNLKWMVLVILFVLIVELVYDALGRCEWVVRSRLTCPYGVGPCSPWVDGIHGDEGGFCARYG